MFGTEYHSRPDRFHPDRGGTAYFFLLLALAFVGPGQELGRVQPYAGPRSRLLGQHFWQPCRYRLWAVLVSGYRHSGGFFLRP
jgi:hypothetical protein